MNLKPEELVKALRCCVCGAPCQNCPEVGNDNCMDDVHVFAADQIERDQKEIAELREENERLTRRLFEPHPVPTTSTL